MPHQTLRDIATDMREFAKANLLDAVPADLRPFTRHLSRGLRITFYIFTPNRTATLMCIRDQVDPGSHEIQTVRENFDLLPGTYRAITFTNGRREHIYLMTFSIALPNQPAEQVRQRELL